MDDYKQRVVIEKEELDNKIESLEFFFKNIRFTLISVSEKKRMKKQLKIMKNYSEILGQRISFF